MFKYLTRVATFLEYSHYSRPIHSILRYSHMPLVGIIFGDNKSEHTSLPKISTIHRKLICISFIYCYKACC